MPFIKISEDERWPEFGITDIQDTPHPPTNYLWDRNFEVSQETIDRYEHARNNWELVQQELNDIFYPKED